MSDDIDLILNSALEKLGIGQANSELVVDEMPTIPELQDDEIHILDAIQDYENKMSLSSEETLAQENQRIAAQFQFLDEIPTLNEGQESSAPEVEKKQISTTEKDEIRNLPKETSYSNEEEKFDFSIFEEKRTYKSESGREMTVFPKLGVRESNNVKKIANWYYEELLAEANPNASSIALEMGKDQYTVELVKKANELFFANTNGPDARHKVPNKDELKAIADEKESVRRQQLLAEAQKRVSPEALAEAQRKRENKLKLSAVIDRAILDSRSPAFAKELMEVLGSAIEKCPEPVTEIPDDKQLIQMVAEESVTEIPATPSPSYYALVSQGEIIGSGRADKISHEILFNMAKDAKAALIWSVNELNQKTDLMRFFGIENITPNTEISMQADKYDMEVEKGQRMLSNQKILKTSEPGIKIGEVIMNPQINIKKDSPVFDVNEYQKKQIVKIVKRIDDEMPNVDVLFFFDRNTKNVVVNIKSEKNRSNYFEIAPDKGPTKMEITLMEALKKVAQLEWNKLELMEVCAPITEQSTSQSATFNN